MTQNEIDLFGKCPFATAQKVFSGKWSILLIQFLSERTYRFGELQRKIPEITQATLTKQLRKLEEYGLIHREVYQEVPPKVEYSLTELGRAFSPVLEQFQIWGDKYIESLQEQNSNFVK